DLFELAWKMAFDVVLRSAGESMTRAIGLTQSEQISPARFDGFNTLHYEVENRSLRLIEKLEQKRDDEDWIARISQDPSEYDSSPITPFLHHSITPALRIHA